jgi:hypothetical protein
MQRNLRGIARAAEERAHDIAELIVQEIEMRSEPRDTGELLRGWWVERADNGDALIMTDVRYWMFVEYGTGNHEAQPFLGPSIDTVRAALR